MPSKKFDLMSNLKLAVETATTVARFARVEEELRAGLRTLDETVQAGFKELREAMTDQASAQQGALDQLLDLLSEQAQADAQSVQDQLTELLRRVEELERRQPPAA